MHTVTGGRSARPGSSPPPSREDAEKELWRVTTRLAGLGPARLTRPDEDGVAPQDRVRPVLQALADAAADAEGRPRRDVPVLGAHALGDQLVVLVRDLLAATDDEAAVEELHDRLVTLRREL